jgi:glucose-6-phosphate isomerase
MKDIISVNIENAGAFISPGEVYSFAGHASRHIESLNSGKGAGSDFLGWLNLPDDVSPMLDSIEKKARHLRSISDATIVIGIGGSYLGAKAVIEALTHPFNPFLETRKYHDIFFAGHNICEDHMSYLLDVLDKKDYSIIVISKSGTTTEPAIAFRILREHLEKKTGKAAAADRIVAITDNDKGALRLMAGINGYDTFAIPDNIGGRYSVLTPVGLLPIAVSGLDIKKLVKGAKTMEASVRFNTDAKSNPSLIYAAARNLLLGTGRPVEILACFTPALHYLLEWWKQLYGESEGKEGKGIFPASVDFTTDLHSMGQYIQEGQRILFETILSVGSPRNHLVVPGGHDNSDNLDYLAGKRLSEINRCAENGTILAHNDGNVPVIKIEVPSLDEYALGQLFYFFEMACAISGYMLGVNPFDQPGVEAYKMNMFALLDKPGFEEAAKRLKGRL